MPLIYPVIPQSDLDEGLNLNSTFFVLAGLCDEIIDLHATLAVCSDISAQSYSPFPLFPSQPRHEQHGPSCLYGCQAWHLACHAAYFASYKAAACHYARSRPCNQSNHCICLVNIQSRLCIRDACGAGGAGPLPPPRPDQQRSGIYGHAASDFLHSTFYMPQFITPLP